MIKSRILKIANSSRQTTWITIIPLMWIILQNSKGAIFWKENLDLSVQSQVEGSPLDQVILMFLLIMAFSFLFVRRSKIIPILKTNFWLVGLLLYMLVSILWADYPMVALRRWIKTFGTLVMVALLVTEENPLNAGLKVLKQSCFIILPISFILILLVPSIGTTFAPDDGLFYWTGVTNHKNSLGRWGTLGVLLFIWLLFDPSSTKKNRVLNLGMLAISWILLIGSKSTTSLTLAIEGMGVFVAFVLIKRIGRFGFITVPLIVMSIGSFLLIVEQFLLRTPLIASMLNLAGKDSTLTGRTSLWEYVLSVGAQKAWFGHGYATFWLSRWGDQARSIFGWDMYSAHNGFLDVYLQLGIVGLCFLIVYIVFAVRGVSSVYKHDYRYGVLWITFLITTLISNLTESNFGVLAHEFWFLSVLVSFNIPSQFLVKKEEIHVPIST